VDTWPILPHRLRVPLAVRIHPPGLVRRQKRESVKLTTMSERSRRPLRRQIAAGTAVLLLVGGTAWLSLSAPSRSEPSHSYIVINPVNGRIISSGPVIPSGATVSMNPRTGQIVNVSR
jgi:hypothetical protein